MSVGIDMGITGTTRELLEEEDSRKNKGFFPVEEVEEVAEEEEEEEGYTDWSGWVYNTELKEVGQITDGDSIIPICKVYSPDDLIEGSELLSDEEAEANARLITHAPDMQDMLVFLLNNHFINDPDVVEDVADLLSLIKG